MSTPNPWSMIPIDIHHFKEPPREYGILPFWFLNGELDPEEMRYQIREFSEKGIPGIILHGRYGLEIPYISPTYLERIRFAVEEAEKLGLKTWIYDEMNWPSGTADKHVLQARPDLAQRYIECLNFTIRGPWFTYLTGADSRYLDFERSTPVAAFAISLDGNDRQIIDLTPNLSFVNVIPWEAPAGNWRLVYIVEKEADYYIDALNPESTAEFLHLGYEPYARVVDKWMASQMLGFYTDEPAMHYFLSGADNAVVPWTRDMFRRFQERNGYNLRPHLPDLFFDLSPESARVRFDFYSTLTDFYSQAYYQQIHRWCQEHNVLFTGHLLYEEGVRGMIRVEGNLFKHYRHMDVVGVDHLYPIVGTRDRPNEHVAMKVASSAAHLLGSPRLLCESFGGIFMDTTMQRMKWIADWEYVLGVNLLNPHGFHYTLEGPRKRDWPPSMFYQYPWWSYYNEFSKYISRLSHLLSGGRHVAKVAVLWPINSMFAIYTPQRRTPLGERLENDTNVLTDLLLRLHFDFDYLDEDLLAEAELKGSSLQVGNESYELLILPPMTHLKLTTIEKMEQFVDHGGKLFGMVFIPDKAFSPDGLVDVSDRMHTLFGVNPIESQQNYRQNLGVKLVERSFPCGGKASFLSSYGLARQLPMRLQEEVGTPGQTESPFFVVETGSSEVSRYYFSQSDGVHQDITDEVNKECQEVAQAVYAALTGLITPDVTIDHPDVFYLHRIKDDQDIYFFVNPTFVGISTQVSLTGQVWPVRWDPSTGNEYPIVPLNVVDGRTYFQIDLSPTGSVFVLPKPEGKIQIIETNLKFDSLDPGTGGGQITGYGLVSEGFIIVEQGGKRINKTAQGNTITKPLILDGDWEFQAEAANALVLGNWLATQEQMGMDWQRYTNISAEPSIDWLPMVPGAWAYQLPTEPSITYPIPVWYQIRFLVEYMPPKVDLIVDGFAGSEWKLYINGQPVTSPPVRSTFDSQMKAVDITPYMKRGNNLITLRLVVTKSTDGLLDLLKITGDFCLTRSGDGSYQISAPRKLLQPRSWTEQGYPFYSGSAVYRKRFQLPDAYLNQRVFLQAVLQDDALEVLVNGQPAGVRLWPEYDIEITKLLKQGENLLELRVANTLINLLEAIKRPSGLSGVPRLVGYQQFTFDI